MSDEQEMMMMNHASEELRRQLDSHKIHSLTQRVKELTEENKVLSTRQLKGEKDTHEFVAYFQREVARKDDTIADLTEQISSDKVKSEMTIEGMQKAHAKEKEELVEKLNETTITLNLRIKSLQDDLNKLEVFRDMKDVLENKLHTSEIGLYEQKKLNESNLSDLERKFIEEKSKIQKDTERRIEKIQQQSREEARSGLNTDTRKIVMDNKRMGEELRFQLEASDALQRENLKLEERNKKLSLEVNMLTERAEEYAKQGHQQGSEIKELKLKIKSLERNTTSLTQALEQEKFKTLKRNEKEVAHHELDVEGYQRLLRLKNKELKTVRELAQTVLAQRTDVEQFFLEALAYVKAEHLQEKKMAHMKNMSDFKMQMRSATINPKAKFPKIQKNLYSKSGSASTPPTLSKLPKAPSEKVDLKELTWEDKERVLRLLFAKINSLQGVLDSAPAMSASTTSSSFRHEATDSSTAFLTQPMPPLSLSSPSLDFDRSFLHSPKSARNL